MRKQPYNISGVSQKIEGTVSQMLKSPNNLISALFSALWEDISSVTWTWDFPLIIVTALPLEEPSVKTKIAPSKGWIENFLRKITECVFKKCKKELEGKWNKIWPLKSIRATCQSSLFCKRNFSWSLLNGICYICYSK